MRGTEGSLRWHPTECGKVPYRILGLRRPVKPLAQPCRSETKRHQARLYNQTSFGSVGPDIEATLRKRKKEGFDLRLGLAGLVLPASRLPSFGACAAGELVQLQQ